MFVIRNIIVVSVFALLPFFSSCQRKPTVKRSVRPASTQQFKFPGNYRTIKYADANRGFHGYLDYFLEAAEPYKRSMLKELLGKSVVYMNQDTIEGINEDELAYLLTLVTPYSNRANLVHYFLVKPHKGKNCELETIAYGDKNGYPGGETYMESVPNKRESTVEINGKKFHLVYGRSTPIAYDGKAVKEFWIFESTNKKLKRVDGFELAIDEKGNITSSNYVENYKD